MAIQGKKINELEQISVVSNETVLPAVYVNAGTPNTTATKVSIEQISNKIQADLEPALDTKQDVLTAGDNITITNNVISSTASGSVWGEIEGDIEDQTDLQNALNGKQGVTSIVTLTTSSIELATNTIHNGGELVSVTLTLPATVPVDFIAQVEFTSGATATTFTAPASLYFNGDACEGGVLTPLANKRYCIMVISDGVNTLGFVVEK